MRRNYNQPSVTVAHIMLESMVLAGSSTGGNVFYSIPDGGDPNDAI